MNQPATTIRPEQAGEEAAIHAMVKRAFIGHAYSDGDEQHVIDRLRDDGDLVLSLVALDGDTIIGQVTFSEAILDNGERGWFVLGPVAIEPDYQGKGIGRQLIEAGEAMMQKRDAKGMTVLGDPAIYSRFGYAQHTAMTLAGELGEFLQVKSYGPPIPATGLSYAKGFG